MQANADKLVAIGSYGLALQRAEAAEAKLRAVWELPVIYADTKAGVPERVVRADELEAVLEDTATP